VAGCEWQTSTRMNNGSTLASNIDRERIVAPLARIPGTAAVPAVEIVAILVLVGF
jgi:hypothetical protein